MSINQLVSRTSSRGLFTQASLDALLPRVAEVICEHGRRWQRDRWDWRTEGHPPPLNAPEGFTTDNHALTSEQAPGLRAFVRMTWHPQPERPERPECRFLVDFEQIPVFTESRWIQSRLMPLPGTEEEEWLRTLKKVTVRIRLEGLPQRRRDKPLFSKGWPEAWGKQPIKKVEQERLQDGAWAEELSTALNSLPRDVSTACAFSNQGMLEVSDFDALSSIEWNAMTEQEPWSKDIPIYQATVNQRLASRYAPIERPLWINPHKQKPDDIRMQLLLILLQEGMVSDDKTRHELELWAVSYLRGHFRRLSDNTAYEVLLRLQREFVFSEDWRAFLMYTKQVVRGVLAEEYKERAGGGNARPVNRPIPQVAAHLKAEGLSISEKTLYRWKAEGILCGKSTEELWAQARTLVQLKHRRAELIEEGTKRGMSIDNLKKLFQRKKKSDGTPDFEAIEAHIKCYDKEAKITSHLWMPISLEAQIAAWEERLAEAPLGSDQWCEAQDALQRLRNLR
jgi:hypothetical protein